MENETSPEEREKLRKLMSMPFDPTAGPSEEEQGSVENRLEKKIVQKGNKRTGRFDISFNLDTSIQPKKLALAYNAIHETNFSVSKVINILLEQAIESDSVLKKKYEKALKF